MVIPPASTGSDNNSNTAVMITAHPNRASLCNLIPGLLILIIVVMTLIVNLFNLLIVYYVLILFLSLNMA